MFGGLAEEQRGIAPALAPPLLPLTLTGNSLSSSGAMYNRIHDIIHVHDVMCPMRIQNYYIHII